MTNSKQQPRFLCRNVFTRCGLTVALIALILGLSSGCTRDSNSSSSSPSERPATPGGRKAVQPKRDHFQLALEFISQRGRVELLRTGEQAAFHLNRWLDDQELPADWTRDPLYDQLPELCDLIPQTQAMPSAEFSLSDIAYLEGNFWLASIARWSQESPLDPHFQEWFIRQESSLGSLEAERLKAAFQLFDWTVRNVQLVPLLKYPAGQGFSVDSPPPSATGMPGPGYRYYPWQILMFGQGDSQQRSRIFIQLARQLDLDAVMLAIENGDALHPKLWLTAVRIGQELFLFDAELGIPIPNQDQTGIATLKEIQANPSLLEPLTLGENYQYPIQPDDLSKVVALLDAGPEAGSLRMQWVERELQATRNVSLSVKPTELAGRIEACPGITRAQLWILPFETHLYQRYRAELIANNEEARKMLMRQEGLFVTPSPIAQARRRHFEGEFDSDDDRKGAVEFYMEARVPDSVLEQLETSPTVQRQFGLEREPGVDEGLYLERVLTVKALQIQSKEHASYFIGLLQFDKRNFDSSQNWLLKRTLDTYPEGMWRGGANYNLARALEQQQQWRDAYDLYRRDTSPQRHGNLIRSNLLRPKLDAGS